ncbi:MAG TPA: ubiquinol-cytochrome c reductase iron-sulfur subunit [Candidatus Deferrimicrobiaceae bacterium]|nr:ubiquinol-cytochrome c reductase iron-sulfur subunit [Candidatus Deferrimicrobiaceae bacterium]
MEESATPVPSFRADTRRSVLSLALGTVTAAFAASVLYPLFKFLWPIEGKTGGEGSVGIPVEEMLIGQSRVVTLRGEPVLVIREENKVVALSAVCTHLGCLVKYKGGGVILCPCHEASFDLNGNVTGGPAPRPLAYYPVRIVGGRIVVES